MTGDWLQETGDYVQIHVLVVSTTTLPYTMASLDTYDPPPAHDAPLPNVAGASHPDDGGRGLGLLNPELSA